MSSSLFRFSNPQQQQQQTQPLQQQQSVSALQQAQGGAGHIHLMTKERMPVSYQAKWADLHPDSQQLLLYIE
jgi:nucleoporin p58/p45